MYAKIKKWYLKLLEKDRRNICEAIFYLFLYTLSFIYGFIINLRNLLYDKGIKSSFKCQAKVISIGNLSWSGSGKTTLAIYLYDKLSTKFKTAVLRRGYGDDEEKIMAARSINFYSFVNRAALAGYLAKQFSLFILDDGFQYRELERNINIVMMAAREFQRKMYLIPAGIFREPLSSLNRADILIINYKDMLAEPEKIRQNLKGKFPKLSIYFANYKFKRIADIKNKEYEIAALKGKKLAAFAAIGYPEGFFNLLRSLNLNIIKEIVYPDHYSLSSGEFITLQENLKKEGISDIIITAKDKYHFPVNALMLNAYIMEIEIYIEEGQKFLAEVENALKQ
jgi:tetraacyldisaccharide 4'-kinase